MLIPDKNEIPKRTFFNFGSTEIFSFSGSAICKDKTNFTHLWLAKIGGKYSCVLSFSNTLLYRELKVGEDHRYDAWNA